MVQHENRWRLFLILSIIITILLTFVPFAGIILYPFQLFSTFVHESFHAIAGLITGAKNIGLIINPDTSGLTTSSGGWRFIVIPAGYLGTAGLGGLLLTINRANNTSKPLLIGLGIILIVITVFFSFKTLNFLTILFGLITGVFLVFLGVSLLDIWSRFILAFLSVQLSLNSLNDVKALIFISATSGTPTDAQSMSQYVFPLPPIVWAILFGIIALLILFSALRAVFLPSKKAGNEKIPD